jgi:antibiotic biosynthesis monooxygenase (ABM) superfamily enzyme
MWLLLTAAIYPLILLIATLTNPLVGSLPPAVRFLVIVPIMTGTVVWLVLPQIHRRFGRWLAR